MKHLITGALLFCVLQGSAQQTNFSGNFKVNIAKTNFGPAPEWILPRYINVQQEQKTVIISRTALNQNLEEMPAVADTISFDGKPCVKARKDGGNTTSTIRWIDNSSFELTRKSQGADGKAMGGVVEVWTMEDAGKTLLLKRDVQQASGGNYQTNAFFDKQ